MFILSDIKSGGIYAIREGKRRKTVTVFEDYDDAERYAGQLEAEDYEDKLEIIECDPTVILSPILSGLAPINSLRLPLS